MRSNPLAILATLLVPTLLVGVAPADTLTHSFSVTNVPIGGTASLLVPQLDSGVGILQSVTLFIQVSATGTVAVENTNAAPVAWGQFPNGWALTAMAGVTPDITPGCPCGIAVVELPAQSLPAYDGTTDFAGLSGRVIVYTNQGSGSTGSSGTQTFTSPAVLAEFVGVGLADVLVAATFSVPPQAPPGVVVVPTTTANALVQVTYTFERLSTPVCHGESGAPCPCANTSPVFNGCANSVNGLGASLASSGFASIAGDTLVLHASGMTNSSSLFLQGSALASPAPFGDGVLCLGGTLRRLGAKSNTAGAAQFPGPGDLPISVRGLVTSPGAQFYQVYYRDLGAFCPPATFNITRGVRIYWQL